MKRRILFVVGIGLLAAGVLLPVCTWNLHLLLSGAWNRLEWDPLFCWQQLLDDRTLLRLYLMLVACVALLLYWAVASSSYVKYRSSMYLVQPAANGEPALEIPMPAGQGQFGTAWWFPRRKMKYRYHTVTVTHDEALMKLLQAGEEDYAEVENEEGNLN